MLKKRLIAVLICRNGRVIQSVRFRHTNVIHYDPVHAMEVFNKWSVDEIVILNVSPDQDSRNQFREVVENISRNCFVPLAVGGWITDDEYANRLLRSGADKLVLNTVLEDDPELVNRLSRRYGQQCIVASIDILGSGESKWSVAVDRGTRHLRHSPEYWASHAVLQGCGEIFLNSIDHDGARRGYNLDAIKSICKTVDVPVIAFGGVFDWGHLVEGIEAGASAVAVANLFHYTEQATRKAKSYLADAGVPVRYEGRTHAQSTWSV